MKGKSLDHSRKTLILHAGMHKTGSTSIQHFCSHTPLRNAHYFQLGRANHSRSFALLFDRDPLQHWVYKERAQDRDEIMAHRADRARTIRRQIRKSEHSTFIFSAERMSASKRGELARCRKFFAKHVDDIHVYLYYRTPLSYAASRLQQRLKFGLLPDYGNILPNYRKGIGALDNTFGQLNVHVRSMEHAVETNTSIVKDFKLWTGIQSEDKPEVRRNTSLSAEATALLFLYRKNLGADIDSADARAAHDALTKRLRNIRGGKLALGRAFFEGNDKALTRDCAWMSERVGAPVMDSEAPRPGTVEIASFDALESYGREVFRQATSTGFDREFPPGRSGHALQDFIDLLPREPADLPATTPQG